uniref:Putative transcription factor adf-1 n=1 Tax=Xenopsylla cheopis TaxID=163159 RepID=A0A6M2DMF3_XENCH
MNERLIELVRQHNCLYDVSLPTYKHVGYKLKVWEEIAEQLGETSDGVKRRWKGLRDTYMKMRREGSATGQPAGKRSKWIWFDYLSFLNDTTTDRRTETNVTEDTFEIFPIPVEQHAVPLTPILSTPSSSIPIHNFHDSPVPLSPPSLFTPSTKPPPSRPSKTDDFEKAISILANKKKDLDELDHLFLYYAKTLKKCSVADQVHTKHAISQLFHELELNQLNS